MTIKELMIEVCRRGRISVRKNEKGSHLEGALRGFALVKELTYYKGSDGELVGSLATLLQQQREKDRVVMDQYHDNKKTLEEYWEQRYCTLQVEFVFEVVNVAVRLKPTASTRAIRLYAEIVGVQE